MPCRSWKCCGATSAAAQRVARLRREGQADQAAPGGHEVDDFGGDLFGRDGKVAFVFAVFIVYHHQNAAGADLVDSLGMDTKGISYIMDRPGAGKPGKPPAGLRRWTGEGAGPRARAPPHIVSVVSRAG